MKPSDLMRYFNCKTKRELSLKTGYSEVTLWKWEKKGIPLRTQAVFELTTKGKLKADLASLTP